MSPFVLSYFSKTGTGNSTGKQGAFQKLDLQYVRFYIYTVLGSLLLLPTLVGWHIGHLYLLKNVYTNIPLMHEWWGFFCWCIQFDLLLLFVKVNKLIYFYLIIWNIQKALQLHTQCFNAEKAVPTYLSNRVSSFLLSVEMAPSCVAAQNLVNISKNTQCRMQTMTKSHLLRIQVRILKISVLVCCAVLILNQTHMEQLLCRQQCSRRGNKHICLQSKPNKLKF